MLVDTHVALWILADDARLGPASRAAIQSADRVDLSSASIWEIAIKAEAGKLEVPEDLPERIRLAGFAILPVFPEHAWATRSLAGLPHRDPFDRLLLSQAITERTPFLTADRVLLDAVLEPAVERFDARQ